MSFVDVRLARVGAVSDAAALLHRDLCGDSPHLQSESLDHEEQPGKDPGKGSISHKNTSA